MPIILYTLPLNTSTLVIQDLGAIELPADQSELNLTDDFGFASDEIVASTDLYNAITADLCALDIDGLIIDSSNVASLLVDQGLTGGSQRFSLYASRDFLVTTISSNLLYLSQSFTPPRTGDYLVIASCVFRFTTSTNNYRINVAVGSDDITNPAGDGWIEDETKDTQSDIRRNFSVSGVVSLTEGVPQQAEFRCGKGSTSGTFFMYSANITIMEL